MVAGPEYFFSAMVSSPTCARRSRSPATTSTLVRRRLDVVGPRRAPSAAPGSAGTRSRGSFGVGPVATADPSPVLRASGSGDPPATTITPPVITPTVSGTQGTNGWYVSDVTVSWDVTTRSRASPPRSAATRRRSPSDTTGTTFTCQATSCGRHVQQLGGRQARHDAADRDVPTPPPVFEIYQLGAWVPATVTDATSGPGPRSRRVRRTPHAAGTFTATVTGADRAGNRTRDLRLQGGHPDVQRADADDRRHRAEQRHQRHRAAATSSSGWAAPTRSTVSAATT